MSANIKRIASVDVHGTYTNVNLKISSKIVCSVSCVVASGDVMMDSGWKPLFFADNLSK